MTPEERRVLGRVQELIGVSIELLGELKGQIEPRMSAREHGHIIAGALYARACEYLDMALQALTQNRLLAGHALTRSALECQFACGALNANPKEAILSMRKAYLLGVQHHRSWLMGRGIKEMSDGRPVSSDLKAVQSELESPQMKNKSGKVKRLAILAGMEDEYLGPYSLLSTRSHAGYIDSITHDQVFEREGQMYLRLSHEDIISSRDLAILASIAHEIWNQTSQFFAVPSENENWRKLMEEIGELAA